MKFRGRILGMCDSYQEDDDGSCSDVFEVHIEAKSREDLERIREDMKVTVEIRERGKK